MLINATKSRLVIGRFSILPGEKVPTFQLTGDEAAAVDKFKSTGRLVEKPGSGRVVSPQPEPEKVEAKVEEKVEEAPQEAPQTEKAAARRQKAKAVSMLVAEDAAVATDTASEQVSQTAGE